MDCQEISSDDEMLIKLVEEISYIYDKKLNLFKDKIARTKAWQSIAKVLNKTPLECEQRWTILRHRYATEKRRMREDQSIKQSFWPLFNAMTFLNAFIMPRKSSWNMKRQESNYEDSAGSMSLSPRENIQHIGDDEEYDCYDVKPTIDSFSLKTEATDYEVHASVAKKRSSAESHHDLTSNPNETFAHKSSKDNDKITILMECFVKNMGDYVERDRSEALDPEIAFGRTVALHLKDIDDKKKRNAVKLRIMKALLEGDGEIGNE